MEYRSVLGYPAFRNLWLATGIASVGTRLFGFAFIWLVFEFTGSATMLAVALAIVGFPKVLSTLLGGVLADRFNRIRIIVWSELVRAALLPLIPVFAVDDLPTILVLGMLIGIVGSFEGPARQAVVPNLVPDEELDEANGVLQILIVSSYVLFVVAGWLVSQLGAPTVMLLSAIPSVASVFALLWIPERLTVPVAEEDGAGPVQQAVDDVGRIVDLFRSNEVLGSLFVLRVANLFLVTSIGPLVLPMLTVSEFGGGSFTYGVLFGSFYAGMFLGAGVFGSVTDERDFIHGELVIGGITVSGFFLACMALAPVLFSLPLIPAVVLHGLAGIATFHAAVAIQTLMQLIPSDTDRGKAFSMLRVVSLVVTPLSYLVFGPLVTALGAVDVLLGIGVGVVGLGLLMTLTPLYAADVDEEATLGNTSDDSSATPM